mgnify:CR=1 FL=1
MYNLPLNAKLYGNEDLIKKIKIHCNVLVENVVVVDEKVVFKIPKELN